MAGSVNKVILIGNLGKDPEIRRTQDGRPIASFRIATSESWKDKRSGERVEKTEWHSVVVFNENLAKIAEQYLKKGSKVYIEGQLQTRKWQDKDGVERYTTEVILQSYGGTLTMLEGRQSGDRDQGDREQGGEAGYGGGGYNSKTAGGQASRPNGGGGGGGNKGYDKALDDEIPFFKPEPRFEIV